MRLPDGDGLDLVGWMQENRPQVPVAVITAHGNVESAVRALKLGAFDFVSKPLDLGVLRKLVGSAIKLGSRPDGAATTMVTRARASSGARRLMQQLREMIVRVARSQAPVHIFGESGTGKELVARLIHDSGARSEGPFVAVNCGAIPTELMESELFGHKRGSFTGAVADKKGLVQSAEGGTLFLDEVADLPLHMQVKLLRVVQEKTVRPIGEVARRDRGRAHSFRHSQESRAARGRRAASAKTCSTASTSSRCACPACASAAKTFRSSPTTSCSELCSPHEDGSAAPRARSAADALENYAFPGNVRELENVLERAVTLCTGGRDHGGSTSRCAPRCARRRKHRRAQPRPTGQRRARRSARRHRARRHREGAREDPLQQDRRREAAGHELPGAALPDQEARDRVSRPRRTAYRTGHFQATRDPR